MRENNLTANPAKCLFNQSSIDFFGHHFSADGNSADDKKVASLINARPLKNATEVRSFLGLAQYLARFIKDFASISARIRQLTHQNAKWVWGPEQQHAFDCLKARMATPELANCWCQSSWAGSDSHASHSSWRNKHWSVRRPLTHWLRKSLQSNRKRGSCSSLGNWALPLVPLWVILSNHHGSQTVRNDLQQPHLQSNCETWEVTATPSAIQNQCGLQARGEQSSRLHESSSGSQAITSFPSFIKSWRLC